jgi:hypothetical protein
MRIGFASWDKAVRYQTGGMRITSEEAIALIRKNGIILEAGRGPMLSLVEAAVGGVIRGSWWSHPRSKEIFRITRAARSSKQILVCRLVAGKITFVHRKLWPALVCVAGRFPPAHLARLVEEHTSSGRHVLKIDPFPNWVPLLVTAKARKLTEKSAVDLLNAAHPALFAHG